MEEQINWMDEIHEITPSVMLPSAPAFAEQGRIVREVNNTLYMEALDFQEHANYLYEMYMSQDRARARAENEGRSQPDRQEEGGRINFGRPEPLRTPSLQMSETMASTAMFGPSYLPAATARPAEQHASSSSASTNSLQSWTAAMPGNVGNLMNNYHQLPEQGSVQMGVPVSPPERMEPVVNPGLNGESSLLAGAQAAPTSPYLKALSGMEGLNLSAD